MMQWNCLLLMECLHGEKTIHRHNSGCDMMENNDLISNLIQSMNNEFLSSSYVRHMLE